MDHARPTVSVSDNQIVVWLEEEECASTLFLVEAASFAQLY